MNKPHIWLRAETKPQEQRTALTPLNAKKLLDAGFTVTVEKSSQNIFPDTVYQSIGCKLMAAGSWINAPQNAIILGLKELPEADFPLIHQHIFFAHVYKEQQGWQALLSRFKTGGGKLYDLEYLVDDNNRRIAAFGYWAGFAGAALAIHAWINQQNGQLPALKKVSAYQNKNQLITELSNKLATLPTLPKVIVIGAKGRSGCGAVGVAKELGLETTEWDLAETQRGGPFAELNNFDVLVNCVFITGPKVTDSKAEQTNDKFAPFITKDILNQPQRKLSLICDVSCDPYGSYNPLPIYDKCTTFALPCIDLTSNLSASNLSTTAKQPLSLIAIDHLPSLLPKESSEDYGQQLIEHLLGLNHTEQGVWPKALHLFKQKVSLI